MRSRQISHNQLQTLARAIFAVTLLVAASARAEVSASASASVPLQIDGLGKGTSPLSGPWQFHTGDDPSWATAGIDDATGHNGWEQLSADKPWGLQGHASYTGFAWYRRELKLTPSPGASPDIALLIPVVDEVYELYWNGKPVGHFGSMPPHLVAYQFAPAQTFGLGPVRSGVLAVRVFKLPLASVDDGTAGGFEAEPLVGSPEAIATAKDALDYQWLRREQFSFGLTSLYALVAILSLAAWVRDRSQWLLFWMAIYTACMVLDALFVGMRLPWSVAVLTSLQQAEIEVRETSQWFLLLWLLQLHDVPRLIRLARFAAIVSIVAGTLDGLLSFLFTTISAKTFAIADATFTFCVLLFEALPVLLVSYAFTHRKRLDSARWLVAGFAFSNAAYYFVQNVASQFPRYTHWTLANRMTNSLFTLNGNTLSGGIFLRTLLFISIVYAIIRYAIDNSRRQLVLEREFQNARELQQVLVPETLPVIPGFTFTSAYKPAQEVGGDFFQIIPLEGRSDGSTLIILGDVSGKGLKAAMTVSLIVGAIRTLVDFSSSPSEMLTGLNRRLYGRMQEGFATCIVLRLDADGMCTVATAGHPAPFLNSQELDLPGALPLGLIPAAAYDEITLQLKEGDRFALYTDGLLEARGAGGEIFSFQRLEALFATNPSAAQATDAAVDFGQDDDITVLTFTRLSEKRQTGSPLAATLLAGS